MTEQEAADDKTAVMVATGVLLPIHETAIACYAGAGWSKTDTPDQAAWDHYLEHLAERCDHR